MGYEIHTGVRFSERGGHRTTKRADVKLGDTLLARLTYGPSADLWRINLGWRRRAPGQFGFGLDVERGYWAKSEETADDPEDPMSPRTVRVIPFVRDTKNCLLFEPSTELSRTEMASLQAALKNAIQIQFQLEDDELAAEPLPSGSQRNLLLFYESSEGGAGVLRQLVDRPETLARVAREALSLCHYDPETGTDLLHGPRARENCVAACYDCLMGYYNQGDHRWLDRASIRGLLQNYVQASVEASPAGVSRAQHLQSLLGQSDSALEREWLTLLDARHGRLPDRAQALVAECHTRPDFLYEEFFAAIYVDGPHHQYPERSVRDAAQADCMEDHGYTVLRFGLSEDWAALLARYPHIFGGQP